MYTYTRKLHSLRCCDVEEAVDIHSLPVLDCGLVHLTFEQVPLPAFWPTSAPGDLSPDPSPSQVDVVMFQAA